MIVEGIITTVSADGGANVAAMGAVVGEEDPDALARIVLRPYKTTTTYANLKRVGEAVFHVTDDVALIARAALDRIETRPRLEPAQGVTGWIVADACRWYALRMTAIDETRDRAEALMEVVARGRIRDSLGLCRAKHAVVEAAIMATRTHLLAAADIAADMARLSQLVMKTGGPKEIAAFGFLLDYIQEKTGE